jgi:hypothetical protein
MVHITVFRQSLMQINKSGVTLASPLMTICHSGGATKLLFFLLVLIIFTSVLPIYSDSSAKTLSGNQVFLIENTSSFVDESDLMHVYGEVRNKSNMSMTNVTINGSFYDKSGRQLNDYQRSCELPTINAGGICPFEIIYIDTKTTNRIEDFKLTAQGIASDTSKPTKLKFHPENSRLDILGFYYINGRISNEGSIIATDSSVVATLYDKDGKVIAIGRALAEPANILPDSLANFGIAVAEKSQVHKTRGYSLMAFSTQYASPPLLIDTK